MSKPKLGSGKRFKSLVKKLDKDGDYDNNGADDPAALAAWIGRKKYGKKKFAGLAKKAKAK